VPAEPSPSVPHPSPEQFASILELRLPREDLAREALLGRCRNALRLRLAAVTVAPVDLDDVARLLRDTPMRIAVNIDPAGSATTAVKQYAARDALRRGARIVEAAIHRGKMLSREFRYLEGELQQIGAACHEAQAVFRLAVRPWRENAEEFDILIARMARRARVDVLSSTDLAHACRLIELSRERYQVVFECSEPNAVEILAARAAGCAGIVVNSADPEQLLKDLATAAEAGS
jgi:hypothetical protein